MSNFSIVIPSEVKRLFFLIGEQTLSKPPHAAQTLWAFKSCSSHVNIGSLRASLNSLQRLLTVRNLQRQKEIPRHTHQQGFIQALIKIYTPCNLPNLFSCQISSSPAFTGCPPRRVWIVPTSGCATPQSSNPMFDANDCRSRRP